MMRRFFCEHGDTALNYSKTLIQPIPASSEVVVLFGTTCFSQSYSLFNIIKDVA